MGSYLNLQCYLWLRGCIQSEELHIRGLEGLRGSSLWTQCLLWDTMRAYVQFSDWIQLNANIVNNIQTSKCLERLFCVWVYFAQLLLYAFYFCFGSICLKKRELCRNQDAYFEAVCRSLIDTIFKYVETVYM